MTNEVLKLVSQRAVALATQNWEVVEDQLHPRFIYTNSHGIRLTTADYVDFLARGPLRWRRQSLEEASIVHVGDTTVLHGIVVDDLLINGEPCVLRFATTQTYVRIDERWHYLAGHTAQLDGHDDHPTRS